MLLGFMPGEGCRIMAKHSMRIAIAAVAMLIVVVALPPVHAICAAARIISTDDTAGSGDVSYIYTPGICPETSSYRSRTLGTNPVCPALLSWPSEGNSVLLEEVGDTKAAALTRTTREMRDHGRP